MRESNDFALAHASGRCVGLTISGRSPKCPSLLLLLRDKIALTVSSGSGTSPPLGG